VTSGPRVRPWAALIIAGGLAVLAAVLLWDAAGIAQGGGYAGVGPAGVPRMVAIGLLILSFVTVVAGFRGDLPRPPRQEPGPVLWVLLGLGLQLGLLHVLGFAIAAALLFACTARAFGNRNLALGLGIGLGLGLLTYGLFDRLLQLNLPAGALETTLFGG
jgi:putative tricarboxylic transport membrane protein